MASRSLPVLLLRFVAFASMIMNILAEAGGTTSKLNVQVRRFNYIREIFDESLNQIPSQFTFILIILTPFICLISLFAYLSFFFFFFFFFSFHQIFERMEGMNIGRLCLGCLRMVARSNRMCTMLLPICVRAAWIILEEDFLNAKKMLLD